MVSACNLLKKDTSNQLSYPPPLNVLFLHYLHVKYVSINYANYRFYLKVTLLLAKKCFFFFFLLPPVVLFMFASFCLFLHADVWKVAER